MTDSQYIHLVELHREFPQMTIIVVPCNQFGNSEPWYATTVEKFIQSRYKFGENFYVTDKLIVNGHTECNLYKFLKTKKRWYGVGRILSNFEKFLVSPTGEVILRSECYGTNIQKAVSEYYLQ